MSKPLHILLVEDSESDAALLLAELESQGYQTSYLRVQTAKEMRSALADLDWDVVISDYVLPQFSAPAALQVLLDSKKDLPFIVVSGVYGEEAAIKMMKAGADDYVLKGNLSRLTPAIEREMEAAQNRRDKTRAEDAKRHLAAIVESSEDAIYSKNLDGIIISWNPAAERIFGYKAGEIIGHSIAKLFPLDQWDELMDILASIRRNDMVGLEETRRKRKDGRIIYVSVTVSPIKDADGQVIGASSIARDITAKKESEEERLRLIEDLTDALRRVKTLSGMLSICASCKRVRDDEGRWHQVESYIGNHSDIMFSPSLCEDCARNYEAVQPLMTRSNGAAKV